MGKTRYNTIKELLKPIVGDVIDLNKLWRRIMIEVGSDERTLREYIRTMEKLGMISEIRQGEYKIHSNEADI